MTAVSPLNKNELRNIVLQSIVMAKVIYEDQVATHDYSELWLSSDTGVAVGDLTEDLYREGVEAVYDTQNQVVGIFVVGVHR